ncbi:MAG: AIR synthase related protein [Candidatus Altiarchaeota archaeon]
MEKNYEDYYDKLIDKHINQLKWIRKELLRMDLIAKPILGIKDWDDACCVKIGDNKIVVSVDGPYKKRLVMKSALIHASTDILVKGAKPLFALDTLTGTENDIREMIKSLKIQANAMKIPLLGGNTMIENVEPRCSLAVIGKLLIRTPIKDNCAKKNDVLALIGEPIWGSQDERIKKAKILFSTWYKILKTKIRINAAKDVTKGGLISTLYEISEKSKRNFSLEKEIPFPMTRNLDNFLISVNEKNYEKLEEICKENRCMIYKIGKVI